MRLGVNINNVVNHINSQLCSIEKKLNRAKKRIDKIESELSNKIIQVKTQTEKLTEEKDCYSLINIVDTLEEIKNVIDKLDNIEASPSGIHEVSLDSLIEDEYEKMELFVF